MTQRLVRNLLIGSGALILLALTLGLSGCGTRISATDVSCHAFEVIRPSRQDTPETIARIGEHNAAWRSLCDVDN